MPHSVEELRARHTALMLRGVHLETTRAILRKRADLAEERQAVGVIISPALARELAGLCDEDISRVKHQVEVNDMLRDLLVGEG